MKVTNFPLYNFNNGTLMIIIFGVVCVALVITLFLLMKGDAQKKEKNND